MLMETRTLKRKKEKWELTIIKEKVVVNQWKKGQEGKVTCMEFETERERKSGQEGEEEGKRRNGMEGLIIGRDYKE